MALEATRGRPRAAESPQAADLIARYALGEDAVAQISALHQTSPMSFAEAAVRLGFVRRTPADFDADLIEDAEVEDKAQPSPPPEPPRETKPLAERRGPRIPEGFDPRSEEIRSLRTELLMRRDADERNQLMAILSPGAGEGRSQLAAELAVAFAQLGQPTLLVDADLRHPQQHRLFNADNERGLGSALSARGAAVPIEVPGGLPLFLLCAGPLPRNPLELLSDSHFESLINDWRKRYRYVLIDTPPVGRYADGLAIASQVGQVLSLSRADHTSYRDTRQLLRRLSATRSRILGAVINHF